MIEAQNNNIFYAGGFLYNPDTKEVLLHKRDAHAPVNPNSWAFFGGLRERGETPAECFVRELHEEIGLAVDPKDVKPLCDYLNKELNTYRYVFYVESDALLSDLTLGEGEGFAWIPLNEVFDYVVTEKTKNDLEFFIKKIS